MYCDFDSIAYAVIMDQFGTTALAIAVVKQSFTLTQLLLE
jgi:hypothetical protein